MDEGNFNIAGNLFHNILRLYLIHLCPKVLPGQLLDVPKFVCVRPGSLQRSLRPLAAFEGTLCGRKGEKAVRGERKEREGNERGEGRKGKHTGKEGLDSPLKKFVPAPMLSSQIKMCKFTYSLFYSLTSCCFTQPHPSFSVFTRNQLSNSN